MLEHTLPGAEKILGGRRRKKNGVCENKDSSATVTFVNETRVKRLRAERDRSTIHQHTCPVDVGALQIIGVHSEADEW